MAAAAATAASLAEVTAAAEVVVTSLVVVVSTMARHWKLLDVPEVIGIHSKLSSRGVLENLI